MDANKMNNMNNISMFLPSPAPTQRQQRRLPPSDLSSADRRAQANPQVPRQLHKARSTRDLGTRNDAQSTTRRLRTSRSGRDLAGVAIAQVPPVPSLPVIHQRQPSRGAPSTRDEPQQLQLPFLPLIQPYGVDQYLERLGQQVVDLGARSNHLSSRQPGDESPFPSIHFVKTKSSRYIGPSPNEQPAAVRKDPDTTRPTAFVAPTSLRDEKLLARLAPTSEALDRVFRNAHNEAAMSNGTKIVISLYQPPPSTTDLREPLAHTHVLASPATSIDVRLIGQAIELFRDGFAHLFNPQGLWVDGYCRPVPAVDDEQDRTNKVQEDDSPSMSGIPARLWQVSELKGDTLSDHVQEFTDEWTGKRLDDSDLKYLLSMAALSTPLATPLNPDCTSRFPGYKAVFHTPERGCVKLYESHDDRVNWDEHHKRDPGADMRLFCAITGGLGCSFVFDVNDASMVSVQVYPSWQFWSIHRPNLVRLSSLLYQGVGPSLVTPLLVKQVILANRYRLPFPAHQLLRKAPLEDQTFVKYSFRRDTPMIPWVNFPTTRELIAQKKTCDLTYDKCQFGHAQSLDAHQVPSFLGTPVAIEANTERLRRLAVLASPIPDRTPATPIAVKMKGLRPLLMGTPASVLQSNVSEENTLDDMPSSSS